MRPEIEAYLREHGGRYTADALRQQLIAAGHDPADVDAALRDIPAAVAPRESGLATAAWVLYLGGAVVGAGGALLLASLSGLGSGQLNGLLFFAIYATAYLGVGYLLVRVVRAAGSAFEIQGLGEFLLVVVLIPVYGGLMFGTCAAAATFATARGG